MLTLTVLIFFLSLRELNPILHAWEGGSEGEVRVIEKEVDACIVSFSIFAGEFKVGDKVYADVTIRNTGEVKHTFYVNFSIQDSKGKWWDANYEAVTLNPDEIGTVTLYWVVDPSAPPGSYNARVAVWKSKTGGILVERLDYKEQSNAFKVTVPYQLYGYVKYKNEKNEEVPLEGVLVEVRGERKWWPDVHEKTLTDDKGMYWFNNLPIEHMGEKIKYILTVSLTDGKYIEIRDASADNRLISITQNIGELPNIGSKRIPDIVFSKGHEDDAATIFYHMRQAVRVYEDILRYKLTFGIPVQVYVYHPTEGTYYVPSRIYIKYDDSDKTNIDSPMNREWHEFNHHLMQDFMRGEMPPYPKHGIWNSNLKRFDVIDLNGDGDFDDAGEHDENHGRYTNHCTADSWIEGFAEFMSLVIRSEISGHEISLYIWNGNPEGTDLEYNIKAEIDEEFAVAGILWDLYDGINDDNVDLTIQELWTIISSKHTLTTYYDSKGNLIEEQNKKESRYISYIKDLYEVCIQYAKFHDVNKDGVVDEKDVNDMKYVFAVHGFPDGITYGIRR
jgi:hypothetical protein